MARVRYLLFLLPLLVLGCDSNDDVDDGIDLAPLRTTFGCTTIGQISVGQTVTGALASGDCTLPEDGSSIDYYALRVTSSTNVRIDMESAAFDTFLLLWSSTRAPIEFDDDGGSGTNSRITRQLSPGVYVIGANSFSPGESGAYTLRVTTGS